MAKRASTTRIAKAKSAKKPQRKPQARTNWRGKFIAALRESGNISEACARAGVERTAAYHARYAVLAKRPSTVLHSAQDTNASPRGDLPAQAGGEPIRYNDFAEQWDDALEIAIDALEMEARRRAMKGVDEPVFFQGQICGVITRYSDTLLIQLLKAHRPEKYRERVEMQIDEPIAIRLDR